jgi:alkylation response protein AidB-like acyl-CoA dehydrogenase
MSPDPWLHSPAALLAQWRDEPGSDRLSTYEAFWRDRGRAISDTIDRMGTPPLVMYDRWGERVDTIAMPSGYQDLLERGYREGVVASPHASGSLRWSYALGFVTAFFDPGLYCPYTVSLGTTLALTKFGAGESRDTLLARLTRTDGMPWQGATWMTEAGGGSDLGANVATVAEPEGSSWALTGSKYFASNVGAEVAVVAARRRDATSGPRGVGLYAVPRRDDAGELNYRIRRLKDKIATRSVPTGEVELDRASAVELAGPGEGIYPIMEILNVSRVANSVGSVALIQRALSEAVTFAGGRHAFGRPVADQPLFGRQIEQWRQRLAEAFALAWAAADELDAVWLERRPYSQRYARFRLLAHLAKYWTAQQAIEASRWAMEALGGNGAVADFGVERLLREAMILSIWEGTPHRQMLDGLETIQRASAHADLLAWLGEPAGSDAVRTQIDGLLGVSAPEQEAGVEPVFAELAAFTARALARALPQAQ